jgi:hypothetical protein
MRQRRITIASVVFTFVCLLSSARLVIDAPTPASVKESSDEITKRSDRRFSALRAALPERGVVGYIGESGTAALADYYLAQYALAPLVVDHSPNHALVVGNFPASSDRVPSSDLQLMTDFGDGVLLFAGKDNP